MRYCRILKSAFINKFQFVKMMEVKESEIVQGKFMGIVVCGLNGTGKSTFSTGQAMFETAIPALAFIVFACIIRKGAHLQDTGDST